MEIFEKYTFLSLKNQKILALMNESGYTEYNLQTIYNNKLSFKIAMKYLISIDAVIKKQSKSYPFHCYYSLTANGKIFINGLRK